MGVVYKARQQSLNRLVALKILHILPASHQVLSPKVAVNVSVKWLNKQLMLKDVLYYRLSVVGEEAHFEYILDEDIFRVPIPRTLLSQPEELAHVLVEKLFIPANCAGEIAQRIIQSFVEELHFLRKPHSHQ